MLRHHCLYFYQDGAFVLDFCSIFRPNCGVRMKYGQGRDFTSTENVYIKVSLTRYKGRTQSSGKIHPGVKSCV